MIGALKFRMGHVTLTTPIQGSLVILRLGLAMDNLSAKFEVSISTGHEDMKGYAKCRK